MARIKGERSNMSRAGLPVIFQIDLAVRTYVGYKFGSERKIASDGKALQKPYR